MVMAILGLSLTKKDFCMVERRVKIIEKL